MSKFTIKISQREMDSLTQLINPKRYGKWSTDLSVKVNGWCAPI